MHAPTAPFDILFPHEEDGVFTHLLELEILIGRLIAARGTSVLRDKIQRACSRIADSVIEASCDVTWHRYERVCEVALLSCRKIAGFALLMKAAGGMTDEQHRKVRALAANMAELFMNRVKDSRNALRPPSKGLADQDRSENGTTAAKGSPAQSQKAQKADDKEGAAGERIMPECVPTDFPKNTH